MPGCPGAVSDDASHLTVPSCCVLGTPMMVMRPLQCYWVESTPGESVLSEARGPMSRVHALIRWGIPRIPCQGFVLSFPGGKHGLVHAGCHIRWRTKEVWCCYSAKGLSACGLRSSGRKAEALPDERPPVAESLVDPDPRCPMSTLGSAWAPFGGWKVDFAAGFLPVTSVELLRIEEHVL